MSYKVYYDILIVVLVIVEMAPPCTNKENKLDGTNYVHWKLNIWV